MLGAILCKCNFMRCIKRLSLKYLLCLGKEEQQCVVISFAGNIRAVLSKMAFVILIEISHLSWEGLRSMQSCLHKYIGSTGSWITEYKRFLKPVLGAPPDSVVAHKYPGSFLFRSIPDLNQTQ